MSDVKKVVLAYSGGLDTSIIVKWLQDEYQCEVVTFTADVGQGEEVEPARAKAEAAGIKEIYIEDLREEFARDYVFPMFRANAIYEGEYLLGTSIARPLISKRLIEIANSTGADAISHGATGKGNDQVRFELGAYALKPDVKIIAPWRLKVMVSLWKKRGVKNHLILWMLICCIFPMKVTSLKIPGQSRKIPCGNGRYHLKKHRMSPLTWSLTILRVILLPLMVKKCQPPRSWST